MPFDALSVGLEPGRAVANSAVVRIVDGTIAILSDHTIREALGRSGEDLTLRISCPPPPALLL